MRDCQLIITVRDDKIGLDSQDASIVELAGIAGYLQVLVGMVGLKNGLDMDDVKGNMLDIYLAAMEDLEKQVWGGSPSLGGRS